MEKKKIGILGAGTWGIALARVLSRNDHEVTVWSAIEKEIEELGKKRIHPKLPNVFIPREIKFTKKIGEVCEKKDFIIFAVPSPFIRKVAEEAREYIPDGQIIIDVAKGIESSSLSFLSEIIEEEMGKEGRKVKVVTLSGPTHAEEVAVDMPTTIVSACPDMEVAEKVQELFENTCMRVYTNSDIRGVELCGALKNVIALACGIASGVGYGDNTKAAIITRGMAEITRLGLALGCQTETFYGLAGIGDLIVTATSEHSRNNRAGKLIGQGYSAEQAAKEVGMVVEGVNALPAVIKLSEKYNVDMPIIRAVDAIINYGAYPADSVRNLMRRERKNEF